MINKKNLIRFCACGITAITLIGGMSSVAFASEYDDSTVLSQSENDDMHQQAIDSARQAVDDAYGRYNYYMQEYVNTTEKANEAKEKIDQTKQEAEEAKQLLDEITPRLTYVSAEVRRWENDCCMWNFNHDPYLLDELNRTTDEHNALMCEEDDLKEKKAATEEKLEQLNSTIYEYNDIIQYHDSMLQASEMAWDEYQQAQLNLDELM